MENNELPSARRRTGPVAGRWFYLYLILDLYSRKIVGHEVHEVEAAEHAAQRVKRTALAESMHALAKGPVLHGDNGGILKATTVLAMLQWLGIAPSYSRPRVSDDNAFVESLFRTAKYRPGYERAATAVTSNRPIEDRGTLLGDVVVAPLLDRLMHHGQLLRFEGKSWRLKEAAERVAKKPTTE